jgi:hypothetical protein
MFARTCFASYEDALDSDCDAVLLLNVRSELPVRRSVARLLRQVVDLDLVVEVGALFDFGGTRFGGGGSSAPRDGGSAIFGGVECSGDIRGQG